ncbi:DeoxyUTP pyrophosphatase [Aphelenchoides avenae]|nr:DeoxyUTP pyrophosphatase [Aphelenchus avenae]
MNTDEVEVIEPEKVSGGGVLGGDVKEVARRAASGSSSKERKAVAAAFIDDEAKEERKKRKAGATKEKEKKASKKRKRVEISDDDEEEEVEEEEDEDDDEEEDAEESDEDEEESEGEEEDAEEGSTDDGDEEEEEEDSSDDEVAKKKKKKAEKKKPKKAEPKKKKARDGEKKKKKAGSSTKSKALKASTMAKLAKAGKQSSRFIMGLLVCFLLSNAHFPFAVWSTVVVEYVRASEHARAPLVGSEKAAGADLCAAEECSVPAGGRRLVSTGLRVAIPDGYYGRIAPRSGLAVKHFIDVGAGVVDADYRGELKVLLFNFGSEHFEIGIGDRVAQLICEKIAHPVLAEVECLSDTKRGSAGFGSTGVSGTIARGERRKRRRKVMGRRFGSTMHQCTECSEQQKKRLPREWKGHNVFETIQCASCVAGNKAMQAAYYRHFSKFAKK